jgi:hypothetical protein
VAEPVPQQQFVVAAELGDRGCLAGPAAPVTIRPRRALIWCRFSRTSRRPVAYTCLMVGVATTISREW